MQKIKESIRWIKEEGLFPKVPELSSPHAPEVVVNLRLKNQLFY